MTALKTNIKIYNNMLEEISLDIEEVNRFESKIFNSNTFYYSEKCQHLKAYRNHLNKMIEQCYHQLYLYRETILRDLQKYTDFEREIIKLRIFDNLGWTEIGKRFEKSGWWAKKKYKSIVNKTKF